MVDYSKWDQLDISDEEDEKPRVQKFDKPQSVTIGGKNSDGVVRICPARDQEEYGLSAPQASNAVDDDDDEPMEPADEDVELMEAGEDHREEVLECRGLAERALRRGEPAEAVRLLEKAMRMGGADCPGLEDVLQSARRQAAMGTATTATAQAAVGTPGDRPLSREEQLANGGRVGDRYCWSQTRETVEVNVFVPGATKAKAVVVKVTETSLDISVGGASVLAGDWPYKVAPEEDPDWEVRDLDGQRVVRLTVRKPPLPGGLSVVTWWRSLLKGDPTIQVEEIKDRKKEANESFAKAWKEANISFREKTKNHKPVVIDSAGYVVDEDENETAPAAMQT